jgi:hypothetical protein
MPCHMQHHIFKFRVKSICRYQTTLIRLFLFLSYICIYTYISSAYTGTAVATEKHFHILMNEYIYIYIYIYTSNHPESIYARLCHLRE